MPEPPELWTTPSQVAVCREILGKIGICWELWEVLRETPEIRRDILGKIGKFPPNHYSCTCCN